MKSGQAVSDAVAPPSTVRIVPWMLSACGPVRNTTAEATRRRCSSGARHAGQDRRDGVGELFVRSVAIGPGATALTALTLRRR